MLGGLTVVISGVGSGLGREIAQVVIREGGNAVLGARTESTLERVADELDPDGERVAWRRCDIGCAGDPEALVAQAVDRFGGVDGLVNCAADNGPFGGIEGADLDSWESTVSTNIIGTMRMTQAALTPLKERGGSVVMIGTQSALWPRVMHTAYATSKGALLSAVPSLVRELGPFRIRVNTVVPTWMWGPPVEGYVNSVAAERGVPVDEVVRDITVNMPLGEIPGDGDVAEAVGFFLSDRARMITGQTLLVNAGEYYR